MFIEKCYRYSYTKYTSKFYFHFQNSDIFHNIRNSRMIKKTIKLIIKFNCLWTFCKQLTVHFLIQENKANLKMRTAFECLFIKLKFVVLAPRDKLSKIKLYVGTIIAPVFKFTISEINKLLILPYCNKKYFNPTEIESYIFCQKYQLISLMNFVHKKNHQ